jgi:subtilisin family serine protease
MRGGAGSGAEQPTGRYVVVFRAGVGSEAFGDALASLTGASSVASSLDYADGAIDLAEARQADAVVFAQLGLAVVAAPDAAADLAQRAAADPRILAVEPERILYAIDERPVSLDYLRGFRDGVNSLYERVVAEVGLGAEESFSDTAEFTWGLAATGAATSSRTGAGIPVAVLDTGFDLNHPDFAGRTVVSQSLVTDQPVQDGHGHGTHCIGTSCGPKDPPGDSRRYGVATEADIFVGKVLNNEGSGTDTEILAGINWALTNNVRVISMSLGADVQEVSQAYEAVGQRALQAGTLIVAAAGNNANRSAGDFGFVGMPANSPSIMAVAAVDSDLAIADFSARSSTVAGGEVNIAAPGVDVYSSWPMPTRYNTISGTSMATPHVAGIAALTSQATGATGSELWAGVVQAARPLNLPAADVGAGLAQAPR